MSTIFFLSVSGAWVRTDRCEGGEDFLTKTLVFEISKNQHSTGEKKETKKEKEKNAREGPKRDLPAEDDFGPELVQLDNRNQSFFLTLRR